MGQGDEDVSISQVMAECDCASPSMCSNTGECLAASRTGKPLKHDSTWRRWMSEPPPLNDMLIDMTYLPNGGRSWSQRVRDVRPERNVAGLFWRPSAPGEAPGEAPREAPCVEQRDALGAPLRAGEMYVSSKHGLVPVSVEGVRFLIDKEAAR
jgi:hypothetical protein